MVVVVVVRRSLEFCGNCITQKDAEHSVLEGIGL
jgi:hypothetical protein